MTDYNKVGKTLAQQFMDDVEYEMDVIRLERMEEEEASWTDTDEAVEFKYVLMNMFNHYMEDLIENMKSEQFILDLSDVEL